MPTIISKKALKNLKTRDCIVESGHVDMVRVYNTTLCSDDSSSELSDGFSARSSELDGDSAWKYNTIILEASKGDKIRFEPRFKKHGAIDIYKGMLYLSDYYGKIIVPLNVGLEISALESNIIGTIASPANIVTQTGNIQLRIPYDAHLRLCAKTDGLLVVDDEIIHAAPVADCEAMCEIGYETEHRCKKYNGAFEGVKQDLIKTVEKSGIESIYSFSTGVNYFTKNLQHFTPMDICMAYDLVNAQSGTGSVMVSRNRPAMPKKVYTLQQILDHIQKKAFPKTLYLRKREWAAVQEEQYELAAELRDKIKYLEKKGKC